jgi:hypothetical protein
VPDGYISNDEGQEKEGDDEAPVLVKESDFERRNEDAVIFSLREYKNGSSPPIEDMLQSYQMEFCDDSTAFPIKIGPLSTLKPPEIDKKAAELTKIARAKTLKGLDDPLLLVEFVQFLHGDFGAKPDLIDKFNSRFLVLA